MEMKRLIAVFFSFLIIATPVEAQLSGFEFINNNGGLNTSSSPLQVKNNESSDLFNIDLTPFGSLIKRNGYTQLNTSAVNSGARWTGLYDYVQKDGTHFLVGTAGDKFFKMESLDGAFDDITGGLTITAGSLADFATFKNTVLVTNGEDPPFQWAGTGNATAMTVPTGLTKAKFIAVFSGFTILANVTVSGTDHPSRFYWSNIDDIGTWTPTDFVNIDADNGQAITGLEILGTRLVFYKDQTVYNTLFTGDSTIPFLTQKSDSSVGAVSGFSIQNVENIQVFSSHDGIYIYDGVQAKHISDRINTEFDSYNKNLFTSVTSALYRTLNQVWFAYATSSVSSTDRIIIWDYQHNAWLRHKGILASVMARVFTDDGVERLYFGDYDGFVYQADDGTDDNPSGAATAIESYYVTKWFDFGDTAFEKRAPNLYLYLNEVGDFDLSVSIARNFQTGTFETLAISMFQSGGIVGTAKVGVDTIGGQDGLVRNVAWPSPITGQFIRYRFENSQINEPYEIFGWRPQVQSGGFGRPEL